MAMHTRPHGDEAETTDRFANRNWWSVLLFALAGAAIIAAITMSTVHIEAIRSASFAALLVIVGLAVVSAVGWAYTEIHNEEGLLARSHGKPLTSANRLISYAAMFVFVVVLAVAATTLPSRIAPILGAVFIPVWLIGGWYFRRGRRGHK